MVSDIFYFFLLGGGEGECEAPGGGGAICYGNSQERGLPGREVVCGQFGGGGGHFFFFSGPKCPPSFNSLKRSDQIKQGNTLDSCESRRFR